MTTRGSKAQQSLVIALDGDKLGQIGGITLALVVMAFCFYWRETDVGTTIMRTGWAFVVGYGSTFFLARIVLRTALTEMIEEESAKRPRGLSSYEKAAPQEAALAPPPAVDLEDLGLEPLADREDTVVSVATEAVEQT